MRSVTMLMMLWKYNIVPGSYYFTVAILFYCMGVFPDSFIILCKLNIMTNSRETTNKRWPEWSMQGDDSQRISIWRAALKLCTERYRLNTRKISLARELWLSGTDCLSTSWIGGTNYSIGSIGSKFRLTDPLCRLECIGTGNPGLITSIRV
jgi:hypothetical protein